MQCTDNRDLLYASGYDVVDWMGFSRVFFCLWWCAGPAPSFTETSRYIMKQEHLAEAIWRAHLQKQPKQWQASTARTPASTAPCPVACTAALAVRIVWGCVAYQLRAQGIWREWQTSSAIFLMRVHAIKFLVLFSPPVCCARYNRFVAGKA